jgi:hypothetical protein
MAEQTQDQNKQQPVPTRAQIEQARIKTAQKNAKKNAANRGGLVLGANQAHAFAMSSTLNKTKGINDLTNKNYQSWSKQIQGALDIIFFDNYLTNVHHEDITVNPRINHINQKMSPQISLLQNGQNQRVQIQSRIDRCPDSPNPRDDSTN